VRRTNDAGRAIIKEAEGLVLSSYLCPAKVWTIGYGCTTDVRPGQTISESEAEERLTRDLEDAERCVNNALSVTLTDNQFSALVSFVFNLGCGAFKGSTLFKRLQAGDIPGAAKEFEKWNKGGGKVLQGLVTRRKAEMDLFLTV
jgi:lysozyme